MKLPKISYNAPVILTFAVIAGVSLFLGWLTDMDSTQKFFMSYPSFDLPKWWYHLGVVTHIFGHANWSHYMGNFMLILLIGPLLEERYGSTFLMEMILITALITGVCNALFFSTALIGASGIVFMLVLLGSFVNYEKGEVPLTFILVALLFLGKEVFASFQEDSVSQFAHIAGGLIGAAFGFALAKRKSKADSPGSSGGSNSGGGSSGGSSSAKKAEDFLAGLG